MSGPLDPLMDRVEDLQASLGGQVVLRWGTVTGVGPLRVRLDADTDPMAMTPNTLVAGLEVGDRVHVALQNRRATILGKGGGIPAPPARTQGEIPTAITTSGSGSTATIAGDGTITFANCTTINIDGIFDGDDDSVFDVYGRLSQVGAGVLGTRMRYGGTTLVAAGYNYVGLYTRNASGPTRYSVFATSEFGYWWPNTTAITPVGVSGKMTVYGPNRLYPTTIRLESNVSASDRYLISEYGETGAGAQNHDGFSLRTTGTYFGGTVKVMRVA